MKAKAPALCASDERETYTTPERRLLLATIVNAVADALGNGAITNPGQRDQARREAIAWFKNGGADFQNVCCLAGLDPARTRRAALAYIATDTPLPRSRRGNRRAVREFTEQKEAA